MNYLCTLLFFVIVASNWFFCTNLNVAGGSSSTDNGKILGMICLENHLPASNTQVTLRPADFDPFKDTCTLRIDTTDAAGDYAFSSITPGSYTLEAIDLKTKTRALVDSITVDTVTTYAPVAALAPCGKLEIQVQSSANSASCYMYIPGTSRFCRVNNGTGLIDSVPAGFIPAVKYVNTADQSRNHTVKADFVLASGSTREIVDYSLWKYSKRLFINTTLSGAEVSGNVLNFPVLVRLSGANFDFTQAKTDGGDLRFKKSDDSPLSYEIERWDPVGQHAEIWVKVDTVYGNDSTHFFKLYWGNPAAVSESKSTEVFDTSAGFQGVWHFSGDGIEKVYDATANGYHGTPYNMDAASAVEGAVGSARSFNGSSSYVTMPNTASGRLNFPEDGAYSMSLWVYADTIDTIWHAIAGKGHEQYYLQFKCLKNNRATWEFVEFQDQRGWEYSQDSTPPAPGVKQWLYLTGVRSGKNQRLYINGVKVVDTIALMSGSYPRNTGDNFSVGRYGRSVTIPYSQGWSYFKGRIDEVRVSRGVLTADWVRLCYMNQKADDALVVFEK